MQEEEEEEQQQPQQKKKKKKKKKKKWAYSGRGSAAREKGTTIHLQDMGKVVWMDGVGDPSLPLLPHLYLPSLLHFV